MTATPAAAPAGFTPSQARCTDVRKRIIDNAKPTGKEAFPLTEMVIAAMVEAALR